MDNTSGGQGDAACPIGSSSEQNPCTQHGAPALLAKPASSMMGPSLEE